MAYTYHLSHQSSNQPAEKSQVSTHLPARSAGRCPHETNAPSDSPSRHISKTPISLLRTLAAAALLLLGGMTAWGQATVTVGTGTGQSRDVPFNNYYKNSWHEMIYTPTEMGGAKGCTITQIAFQSNTSNQSLATTSLKIYMGERSTSTHGTTADWTPEEDLFPVYSETNVTIGNTAAGDWQTFTLNTPFSYSGNGNLVVVVSKTADSYNSNLYWRTTSVTNSCLYRQNDNNPETYAVYPGTNTGTMNSNRVNTRFTYNNCDYVCDAANKLCTVGDVATTNGSGQYGPVYNWWNYTYRQIIYTSEELGDGLGGAGTSGTIYAIGFQYKSGTSFTRNNVNIYLANTTESSFATATSWIPAANFTPVYSGSVSFTHEGWCWIELTTPFSYDGDNVVLAIDDNHGSNSTQYQFYYTAGPANCQLYCNSDNTNYAHPPTGTSGTRTQYRPNTRFCIRPTCTHNPAAFAFAQSDASVQAGQTFTQTISGSNITYSISPAGIATIDASTGTVTTTSGQYGTVTITARQPATGGYCKRITSYTLNITDCENSIILNRNQTQTIECGKSYCFYDSGINGNYSNNEDYTLKLNSTGIIHITFEEALVGESGHDTMSIRGTTTEADKVYQIAAGTEYVASSTGGTVTIHWHTDGSVVKTGWKAIITATGCGPSTTYTCDDPNTEITLDGNGSTSSGNSDAPIGTYWNYSYHQILYTADDLGGSNGTIYAIGFQYASTTAMTVKNDVTVYLANTDASLTQFTDATWQTPAFTQVYTGRFNFTQQGWGWIVLDSPFNYTGGSLIIALDDNSDGWQSLNFYYHTQANSHLRYNNDNNNPDHPSPSQTATLTSNRPNTKFCIERNCTNRDGHVRITSGCVSTLASGQTTTLVGAVDGGYGGGDASWSSSDDAIATVSNSGVVTAKAPGTVTITYTRAEDGTYCAASYNCDITVNCAENTQTFAFSTTTGTVAEDASINISGNLTVPTGATVTSYTSDNTGVATVTNAGVVTGVSGGTAHITATIAQWTYNGVTYCERTTTNSFTVTVTGDGCAKIGTGTGTTYYCPVNNYYNYTYCQIIYDPSELTDAPGIITSIGFEYEYSSAMTDKNNVSIYLKEVSHSEFSSTTDWEIGGFGEPVYTGPLNCSSGWNTFILTREFFYSGNESLVMAILDNSGDYNSTSYTFRQTSTSEYRTLHSYNDGAPYNMDDPGTASGRLQYRPNTKFCITSCTERDDAVHITNTCPIELPYGTTVQLGGSVDVGAGDATWTSSNGGAATVSGSGLVSAVNMGTTTITYRREYDGTYCPTKATCVVNVVVPTPTITQTDDPLPECGDGNATLVASVPSVPTGYVYHWYSNSTCATEITTGVSGTNNNTLSIAATNGGQVWCRLEKAGSTTSQTFNYSGDIQTYTVPADAESLTLEVWGAQGGSYNATYSGGKGGYSKGTLTSPTAGSTLYVVVGGQPAAYTTIPSSSTNTTIPGGYNGGGSAVVHYYSSNYSLPQGGGGATHIATSSGLLSSLSALQDNVLIVAGGGSGGVYFNNGSTSGFAGYAGGGATSNGYTGGTYTYTANQTAAGYRGSFGQGASSTGGYNYKYGPSGGGGGWYGGGSYTYSDTYGEERVRGHGGGSGYIKSTLTATSSSNGSQSGNGQAKITAVIPTLTGSAGTVTLKCCGIDAEINISAP